MMSIFSNKSKNLSLWLMLLLFSSMGQVILALEDAASAGSVDGLALLADAALRNAAVDKTEFLEKMIANHAGGDIDGILTNLPAEFAKSNGLTLLSFMVCAKGVSYCWFDVINFIVSRGADLDRVDEHGYRALDYAVYIAVEHGELYRLEKLLQCGADAGLLSQTVTEHLIEHVPADSPVRIMLNF